jgi:hypothetical protein
MMGTNVTVRNNRTVNAVGQPDPEAEGMMDKSHT